MKWKKYLPVLDWGSSYNRQFFKGDLIAGLTVCVMLVPQGMAYSMLAGMPPIYGLYGGLIPLFLYGILGTSRQLSLGPVAIDALLILAGISQIAEPGSQTYIELVILTGLLVGVCQFLLGRLRMGFLVNFLSHPVIVGFTSAAAIIIAVSQLKYLFGFSIPRFSHSYETVAYAFSHLSDIHWLSFGICVGGIALMIILRKISRAIPGALIVTILGILLAWFFQLDTQGLQVVGEVPRGLPHFVAPVFDLASIRAVLPTVFTVTVIGIVESIGIARVLEAKNKDGQVRPNQELLALGISKIGGAFFQAIPSSASFTRSAINDDAGAKTGMASIITALGIGLTLMLLTSLFYYLPEAILASIILMAVRSLFDWKEALHLWRTHRHDFAMMMITFVLTLIVGIEKGVLIGVVLSIIMIVYRTAIPHIAVLGKLPDSGHYRNVTRFPEAIQDDNILIIRFDAQLFFGNAEYFKNTIQEMTQHREDQLDLLVLDATSINDVDSSGMHTLEEVHEYLTDRSIQLYMANVIGPVRDNMFKTGLMEKIGREHFFLSIESALQDFKSETEGSSEHWTSKAVQTNVKGRKSKGAQ